MTRRKFYSILLWIIVLGLANFVSYAVMYWYLQGDAKNGAVIDGRYYVRGHFMHQRGGRLSEEIGQGWWLYSYVHSISIWPTVGAILVAMFILARPHIIATMKPDGLLTGTQFVTICITVISLVTGISTLYFLLSFIDAILAIRAGHDWGL